jgi:pentatricopeptide repeat protein
VFTLFMTCVIALDTALFSRRDGFGSIAESLGSFTWTHTDMITLGFLACFVVGQSVMSNVKPSVRKQLLKGGVSQQPKCSGDNESADRTRTATLRLNQQMDLAARAGEASKASELLVEFQMNGGRPDVVSYNIMLRACTRNGDVQGAENWLVRMERRGIEPTVCSYNTLLDAYAKADMPEACESWLERMLTKGVQANVISYATLIHAHARRGDFRKAENWLERMIDADVLPDAVTYNAVIHACSVGGKPERAEHWLSEMPRLGLAATVTTYTAVLDANAKMGLLSRAEAIMQQMITAGLQPNVVTFSALVDACAKANDLARAEHWHNQMLKYNVQPNAHTYSSVVSACGKAKDIQAAQRWLAHAEKFNAADVIVYSSMIDACGKAGDATLAAEVFERMREKGIQPHIVAYAALARPLAYKGDWAGVERLAELMAQQRLRPNEYFIYAQLLSYSTAQPRQATKAEACFRQSIRSGIVANDHIKCALTRAVGKQRADALLDELCGGHVSKPRAANLGRQKPLGSSASASLR